MYSLNFFLLLEILLVFCLLLWMKIIRFVYWQNQLMASNFIKQFTILTVFVSKFITEILSSFHVCFVFVALSFGTSTDLYLHNVKGINCFWALEIENVSVFNSIANSFVYFETTYFQKFLIHCILVLKNSASFAMIWRVFCTSIFLSFKCIQSTEL